MADDLIIRMRLQYDDEFAIKCLLKLYEKQEQDEQLIMDATHRNGVGFNKQDSFQLSAIANLAVKGVEISNRNLETLHELMPKYAKQLSRYLTDEEVES